MGVAGETYLFTNEHVARAINKNPIAHQLIDGERATRVMNPFQVAEYPYDMALSRIEREAWFIEKNMRLALDVSQVAMRHHPVESEFLFVLGYSGQRSYFSPSFETLFTKGTPYLSLATENSPEDPSDMWFAIPYLPDLAKSLRPQGAGLPVPHGLSGSPVWDTNFRRCMLEERQWPPQESRVTGIVVRWSEATGHLIAVRAEYLREFLLNALRCEAAYFRWIQRGRPENDALADWVWAERSISVLAAD